MNIERQPKEELERITFKVDKDTKARLKGACEKPKYRGNMSQFIIEAILEKLSRESHNA